MKLERKTVGGLLAAGCSRRMGSVNKLLVQINGIPMVRHTAIEMLNSSLEQCIVVLGFDSERVKTALVDLPIQLLFNPLWKAGQGSSISTMVKALDNCASDLLIMLGDLPGIETEHINHLINSHHSQTSPDNKITIPKYRERRGNPVVWGKRFFPKLMELNGDVGGRVLFSQNSNSINFVEFISDCALTDINTQSCLKNWLKENKTPKDTVPRPND